MIEYHATILHVLQSVAPTTNNTLGFHVPMFEYLYLKSCDTVRGEGLVTYYGDAMSDSEWSSLGMPFGAPSVSDTLVVCMGDSLTEGYGGGGTNWPDVWASLTGLNVINVGISGQTSVEMLARFDTDVIANSPDYCIIECGTNDGIRGIPLNTCKNNILDMVNLCLANNIKPRFVHYIQRMNQMMLAYSAGIYVFDPDYMKQYLYDVWYYIQSLGYPCLLLNEATDINPENADMRYFYNSVGDYIHPGAEGYRRWASYIHTNFISMCSSSGSDGIYGLMPDWKYYYYADDNRFLIIDEYNNKVVEKLDVTDISEFPIDFTVVTSHQFEVIVTGGKEIEFFVTPKLIKKIYGECPIFNNGNFIGINNLYSSNLIKDSNSFSQRIANVSSNPNLNYYLTCLWEIFNYTGFEDVQGQIGCDFVKRCSYIDSNALIAKSFVVNPDRDIECGPTDGGFYPGGGDDPGGDDPGGASTVPRNFKVTMLRWKIVLCIMGLTMYPDLEPILRSGETQNNRPVYEPWFIWGVFKFISVHFYDEDGGGEDPSGGDNDDDPKLDILSLSPNWSY